MGQYWHAAFRFEKSKSNTWETLPPSDLKLKGHARIYTLIMWCMHNLIFENPAQIVWAGDYCREGRFANLYIKATSYTNEIREKIDKSKPHYLVNKSKKLYIAYPPFDKANGTQLDAMAVLCADGGSEYDNGLVGTWAGDILYTTYKIPKGYEEYNEKIII